MEFLILGPMEAHRAGSRVNLGRRQERRLLGVLLLTPGRIVDTDRLIDLIWDGSPPERARAAIHTYVGRLRTVLRDGPAHLATRPSGYQLDAAPDSIDAHRFTADVERACEIPDSTGRAEALAGALKAWRGPLMADVSDDPFRRRVGAAFDELRLSALARLAEAWLEADRPDRAADALAGLVAADPAQERHVGLLMTALHRAGRRLDALEAFRVTRRVLAQDHGVAPGPDLQRLHFRILSNDPGLDVSARRIVAPAARATFVGRHAELRRLDDLTGKPGAVVGVSGAPGVGTTALVLEWARRAAERFPDGHCYVDLRGNVEECPAQPADAIARTLRALGVPAERTPDDENEGVRLLRSVLDGRRSVLLLDNARSFAHVASIVHSGAARALLVAGTGPWHGIPELRVGPLAPADSVALLAGLLDGAAVDLPRLAERCGHHPLALRLAATWLRTDPELPFDGGAPDPLEAVVGTAYRRLAPPERALFRALGPLAVPELTAQGAARLCRTDPVRAGTTLGNLRDAGLLVELAPGRFAMHELVRRQADLCSKREDSAEVRETAMRRLFHWHTERLS
ncbi:hypothetical protein Val02_39820 [Virgisporangium aliadipatigenens]|uniref:OmpR/PhoB-type domain-containing protein n=1 Tax=Virgisporangium aliadipatigenens TaxID=741659 RepID=A0A8J4DRI7_9ACTN|nr:BTAD domain-containing putative transcriptional regulator [Virgisporangium aliadipatigenens]GIJ47096.1 hypothetical protein Val02_39820 [Virgisporangium aliadipatigenens]